MRNRALLALMAVVAAVLVAISPSSISAKEPRISFEMPKVSKAEWDKAPLKDSPEIIISTPGKKILAVLPGWRLYLQTNEKLDLICWKYKHQKKAPAKTAAPAEPQKCISCHGGGGGFGGGDSSGGGGSGDSSGGGESSDGGGMSDSGNPGGADAAGNSAGTSRAGTTSGSNGTGDGVKCAASGAAGALVPISEVDDLPPDDSPWVLEEMITLPQAKVWEISVKKESKPFLFLKTVRRSDPNDCRDPADPDPAKRPAIVPLLLRKVADAKKDDDSKTSKR